MLLALAMDATERRAAAKNLICMVGVGGGLPSGLWGDASGTEEDMLKRQGGFGVEMFEDCRKR